MKIKVKDLTPNAEAVEVVFIPTSEELINFLVDHHYKVGGDDENINIYSDGAVEAVSELLMEKNNLEYSEELKAKAEALVDGVVDEVIANITEANAEAEDDYEEYARGIKGEY